MTERIDDVGGIVCGGFEERCDVITVNAVDTGPHFLLDFGLDEEVCDDSKVTDGKLAHS